MIYAATILALKDLDKRKTFKSAGKRQDIVLMVAADDDDPAWLATESVQLLNTKTVVAAFQAEWEEAFGGFEKPRGDDRVMRKWLKRR